MEILTDEDVEKFLDKFQDPSFEVERIADMLNWMHHELPKLTYVNECDRLRQQFIKRLIIWIRWIRSGGNHDFKTGVQVQYDIGGRYPHVLANICV